LAFPPLNFGKCLIALSQELAAPANGNIAPLQIRLAFPHCIF